MREQLTSLPYLVRMVLWAVAIMLAFIVIGFIAASLIKPATAHAAPYPTETAYANSIL